MAERQCVYVVELPDSAHRRAVDLIKIVAAPSVKHPAHITLRGPEQSLAPQRFADLAEPLRRRIVRVEGLGQFNAPGQATLFLHCSCPTFLDVWDKPDYAGSYTPHLTIYNGSSRPFSDALLRLLRTYPLRFSFRIKTLGEIVLGQSLTPLIQRVDLETLANGLIGKDLDRQRLQTMVDSERLDLIEQCLIRTAEFSAPLVPV